MGIDLLDLTYRVEREFDISLERGNMMQLLNDGNTSDPPKGAWTDIRVADYVAFVEAAIVAQHGSPAPEVYDRIKKHIVDCLGVTAFDVSSDAWMVRDLGSNTIP